MRSWSAFTEEDPLYLIHSIQSPGHERITGAGTDPLRSVKGACWRYLRVLRGHPQSSLRRVPPAGTGGRWFHDVICGAVQPLGSVGVPLVFKRLGFASTLCVCVLKPKGSVANPRWQPVSRNFAWLFVCCSLLPCDFYSCS